MAWSKAPFAGAMAERTRPRSIFSSVPGDQIGSSEDEAMTRIRGKGVAATLMLAGSGLALWSKCAKRMVDEHKQAHPDEPAVRSAVDEFILMRIAVTRGRSTAVFQFRADSLWFSRFKNSGASDQIEDQGRWGRQNVLHVRWTRNATNGGRSPDNVGAGARQQVAERANRRAAFGRLARAAEEST